MRRALALVSALALLGGLALAGCAARGQPPDYFGYTKKALYVGTLDLKQPMEQRFFVEDGSIGSIHARVWMNATEGGAHIEFIDPSGRMVWSTAQTSDAPLPIGLGEWAVRVTPDAGTSGFAGVLVTRG